MILEKKKKLARILVNFLIIRANSDLQIQLFPKLTLGGIYAIISPISLLSSEEGPKLVPPKDKSSLRGALVIFRLTFA